MSKEITAAELKHGDCFRWDSDESRNKAIWAALDSRHPLPVEPNWANPEGGGYITRRTYLRLHDSTPDMMSGHMGYHPVIVVTDRAAIEAECSPHSRELIREAIVA